MDCENRHIFIYLLLTHIKVHSKPMQRSHQHHKDMPDKVHPLVSSSQMESCRAYRDNVATAHDPSQKRLVISEPVWNEHDGAPSDDEVQRIVSVSEPAWSEHTYDGDPAMMSAHCTHRTTLFQAHFPSTQGTSSKCSAYQQISRNSQIFSRYAGDC